MASLRSWIAQLLPHANEAAREGAWQLLGALMADFTVQLAGLGRQLERTQRASSGRQYLFRWLNRKAWEPTVLYAHLPALWPQELRRAKEIPLLIDCTVLGEAWNVLQVSLPWQGRALPIFRLVVSYRTPEQGQTELLYEILTWLEKHLPGPRERFVLVMDRGFPSHLLIREVQARGWRYVLRIGSQWKLNHATYRGPAGAVFASVGAAARGQAWFGATVLGRKGKGKACWCRTHVVVFAVPEHQDVWVLATSEGSVEAAVRIYRQRMQIEAEFRDLKGPFGLDHLQEWEDVNRVARMLAWVAVYEWRLALLWLHHGLQRWGKVHLQVGGKLSWIRTTRHWLKRFLREALEYQISVRESP